MCLWASLARAEGFAVDRLAPETNLAPQVGWLRDSGGTLSFDDVSKPGVPFTVYGRDDVTLGFDYAALWLHLSAHNRSARPTTWLLEVAEPSLDRVELFILHGDGTVEHELMGDRLPFSQRRIGHPNFVFEIKTAPGDVSQIYLRVQSQEVLRVPLRAWTVPAYVTHHERETMWTWLLVGTLLMSSMYNFGVVAFVRQLENFWYGLVSLAFAAVLLAFRGLLSPLFFPEHPELVNHAAPVAIAAAMLSVVLFMHSVLIRVGSRPETRRVLRVLIYLLPALVVACCIAPVGACLRFEAGVLFLVCLAAPILLKFAGSSDVPELRSYRLGWYTLVLAIPITCLRYAGYCTDRPWNEWALALGFVSHGVLTSFGLASLANSMRGALSTMNAQLVQKVGELKQALARAEDASKRAQRATKAKDEFVATMSHELRTPLNAIINIPQGLMAEFATLRTARCGTCQSSYLLDDADELGPSTRCESCNELGTLVPGTRVKYVGDDARCLRFLQKIERSGQHLLQMVNGVLDYSKLEAGRFELTRCPVDLHALLAEVSEQMGDLAQPKNIAIELVAASVQRPVLADALRLKQVLINLLANAIKFSEPGTTVTLRWKALSDGDQIEIEDRGIGIAAENQDRVFMSFEQVHKGDTRKYGGTGLGLSISRSLVRMHGGELSVRSELGKGSTFVIRLPRLPALTFESEVLIVADNEQVQTPPTSRASSGKLGAEDAR